MAEPFSYRQRVRYVECDALGVVFNAHYMSYMDQALTELFRGFGGYGRLLESGLDMMVVEARLRFFAPARFDDEIDMEVLVTHLGTTSMISRHRIRRRDELLMEGDLAHVWVQTATTAKTPIPDWARNGLAPWYDPAAATA